MDQFYKSINKKMDATKSIPIERLTLSEFNTRQAFIDKNHVGYLTSKIMKRGFHPKRSISVNVIKDAHGNDLSYRVVAGIHRLEAAKKSGLTEIPCLLYCDLTEEEECLLDQWDNEMDEDHKETHYLEEAEHYKYLRDKKKWSQRQIAKNKNASRALVRWRLKMAELPDEIKTMIKGGHTVPTHFSEVHFRYICELRTKTAMLQICQEIATRGMQAEKEEMNDEGKTILPMKQKEISERVNELLELEKKGAIEDIAEPPPESSPIPEKKEEEPQDELEQAREWLSSGLIDLGIKTETWSTDNLRFDIMIRWMKYAPIGNHLGFTLWGTLRTLIEFALRYKEEYFFIHVPSSNGDPKAAYAVLASAIGLKSTEKMEKKHLKELERQEFISIRKANAPGYPKFRIKWDKIKSLYDRYAWYIHFSNGGVDKIPENFSGIISPTPCHKIYVQNGRITEGIDYAIKDTFDRLRELGFPPKMCWKIINSHEMLKIRKIIKDLPYHEERYQKKGETLQNKKGFFLKALKENWSLFS